MDTKYAGTLRSSRKDKRLGYSDNIYDEELGAMQSELNKRFGEKGDASKIYDNEQGKTQAEINKEANGYFYGVSVSTLDGNTTLSMSSRNGDKSVSLLGKLLTSINGSSLGGKLPSGNGYLRYSNGTWEIGNPSVSGGGAVLGGFLTKLNADNPSLLENGFLTYRNGSFYMVEVKADGGGSSSGGTVSQDQIDTAVKDALSNYSWWGRYFASGNNSITGALIGVPSIQFNNGKNVEKLLYLDDNGDLCFNGNFYTTGGISALGKSDTSSGGSSGGGGTSGGGSGTTENALSIWYNDNGIAAFDGSSQIALFFEGDGVSLNREGNIVHINIPGGGSSGGSGDSGSGGTASIVAWGNITGKPSTFTPSAHTHTMSDITDLSLSWSSITGKPSTFAPSAHTHKASDITGLSVSWSAISDKPSSYTPSSHTHAMSEIVGLSTALQNVDAKTAKKLATARTLWGQSFDGSANVSGSLTDVTSISLSDSIVWSSNQKLMNGEDDALVFSTESNDGAFNLLNNRLQIGDGFIVWDATNKAFRMMSAIGGECNFYCDGSITALGTNSMSGGSSGGGNGYPFTIYKNESDTVGVSNAYGAMSLRIGSGLTATVSGRAVTLSSNGLINVYWDEINDKPDTFTPSEHTHKGVDITDLANYLTWGTISGKPSTFTPSAHKHTTSEITDFASKLTWGSILNKPSTFTPSSHTHTASEITDLASKLVWDNITEKPLTFTPSAHTHKTSEIIDLSSFVKATKVDNASHADNADNANLAYKATMLATTRLIWGQDFNGTANVSGSMSGVGNINLSGYINVANSLTSGTLLTLTYNSKSILGFNSNKDLYIGYGYHQDTDAHITLYGSKTLINTYDGSKNRAFWFRDNYLSMPDDGELRIGNGKIVWDEDNKAFRMTSTNGGDCNFYCDGGITALGIQSTTASNGSFAFKNVSADNLNLKKQYGYGLSFGNKLAIWGASETAALHVGDATSANWAQVYVTNNTVFSPAQIYTLSNIVADGGYVEIRNSTLRIKYSGTTYELNVSKAISAGILTAASTQSLEDSPIINELS